jgi:SAM-dependent methyltransferase
MINPTPTGAATYSSAIATADNYTRWIVDLCSPWFGTSLLEVGLGHGGFRRHLPAALAYTGTDIDADSVHAAHERYPRDRFFCADIVEDDFARTARAAAADLDTVLCANVLEHVYADEQAVANLARAAGPGGRVLLYLPAHARLYGRMDALAGHHRRYDPADLARLAGPNRVVHWQLVNPVGALGWWANRQRDFATLDEPGINRQIRWFDRWVLPISRVLTPVTRHWFGLSLFCVIEAS